MKVSIIIPYNQSRGYLGRAISSCEHQEGWAIGNDYEVIVQHGHGGVASNINAALQKCRGRFIKLCAEDDELAPGCLQALYNKATETEADFVCANAHNFEDDHRIIDTIKSEIPSTVAELAERNTIHGLTILYRRAALDRVKIGHDWFNATFWTAEEFELTLRMAAAGCTFTYINEAVGWYRIHCGQKSLVYKSQNGDMIKARYRFIIENLTEVYTKNLNKINRV